LEDDLVKAEESIAAAFPDINVTYALVDVSNSDMVDE
jgi:hypothetical protein